MSVYRDTNTSVVFEHPVAGPLTATVSRDGIQILQVANIAKVNGQFSLPLTYNETQYDGRLSVVWTDGADFSRTQIVEVVTPLASVATLRNIWLEDGETPPPDAEIEELENTVRVVIEKYCGQSFGWSYGQRSYVGNGTGKLILKERCNKLVGILGVYGGFSSDYVDSSGNTNLNGELNLSRAATIEDGWSLLINFPTYLDARQAPPLEFITSAPSQDGTIVVPRRFWNRYDYGTQYTITAEWGYDMIPDEVQEAAVLLANDYASNEVTYRDRYLQILKIQQDSLTYHPGSYRGTGNARVDLLLGDLRRQNGMIVI